MIIGTVGELWRYPVKSMGGERLDHCPVGTKGLLGDRGWAVRDDTAGEIRRARYFPLLLQCAARYRELPGAGNLPHVDITLPDGPTVGSDAEVHARLSALLGRPVSLWPLQPASHTSHYRRAYAGACLMGQLSRSRLFRRMLRRLLPYTSWEATWHGRTLRLGELVVRCELPTARCAMTIQAQADLPKDPTVLRTIVREAGQQLGIYASMVQPGRVAMGDAVDVR
jgi:uncharacterized protein YcbX